jgi:hypothetical protein
MTPQEEGRRLLLQDCEGLNVRWDALQLTGCDLPKGDQDSTLNPNAMETDASRS